MASYTLYPPIVENYIPAFVVGGNSSSVCRLYYSLSKYSSTLSSEIKSIHISVVKQNNGQNVVHQVDDAITGRFRSNGIIIINSSPISAGKTNLYYVDIYNNDIIVGDHIGWVVGEIYKIQIRLSTVAYDGSIGQTAWLNVNSNNFSEWSTYCNTKAIGYFSYNIPLMNITTDNHYTWDGEELIIPTILNYPSTTLNLTGYCENEDLSEILYSYRLYLYDTNNSLLEDSGDIYTNKYFTPNQFHYLFKTELNNSFYTIKVNFITNNKFESSISFKFSSIPVYDRTVDVKPVTIEHIETIPDSEVRKKFNSLTTVSEEEEDGRVGIKLYSSDNQPYSGNLCLRRSDSKGGYSNWVDIKIINCINTSINDLDIIYDNTIESGVWYKYGIQTISTSGNRGVLNLMEGLTLREFEYSFLIGANGRQLKLKYNNTMNSYTYNRSDGKQDPIGSKYPFISRNGAMNYRTFPVNGLISFTMDENHLFTNEKELYKYDEVIDSYRQRREDEQLGLYDYKLEYDFREKVLEFLYSDEPRLFKSASEGNLIIRLMGVAEQPNQSLNRMVYSFTATAHEIADNTMENYLKYGFYEVGNYTDDLVDYDLKVGQLDIDINVGGDIIQEIYNKYDFSDYNIVNNKISIEDIRYLSIEFLDDPLNVYNNAGELVSGNNIEYNTKRITIKAPIRKYSFDDLVTFNKNDSILVLGGTDASITKIHIIVDFFYMQKTVPIEDKQPVVTYAERGIGQIYNNYRAGDDVYSEIYNKYYIEWTDQFNRLAELEITNLEADPNSVFFIRSDLNPSGDYYEIGDSGVVNLSSFGLIKDIQYIGLRTINDTIDETADTNVLVDYIFGVLSGYYQNIGPSPEPPAPPIPSYPYYTGATTVIPSARENVLGTKDTIVLQDIHVLKIPYTRTENPSGGWTVVIGDTN